MRRRHSLFPGIVLAAVGSLPLACAEGVNLEPGSTTGEAGGPSGVGGGGSGGAAGAGGTGGSTGPCVVAADCAAVADTCNVGTCINSVCHKSPANELGGCDDGLGCTENDACASGVCTGSLKACPSSTPCMVGMCDLGLDECVEVQGNDGAGCLDDDQCTFNTVCSGGVCGGGQPTDCSFLDGTCSIGTCDSTLGCLPLAQGDGVGCEDGLFCTIGDSCSAGVCKGMPNTCAAPGDVCLIGSCNENENACTAIPGNEGGSCNDGSSCTTGETCASGLCSGGAPSNPGGACDDENACTTGDTCQNGGCSGAPVTACQDGDGCCPAGCELAVDDDCGGVVYMTSANGDPGFYGYDIPTNTWAILPSPPVTTYSQLTTDHAVVYMLGHDNMIYAYDPGSSAWSQVSAGPGPIASAPIALFKWTPSGFYYAKDGDASLYRQTAGNWTVSNLNLPWSSAGTFDPVSQNLYVRAYGTLDVIVFSTASNSVLQTWPVNMGCGENSRTGSYFNGFFYDRDWSNSFMKVNVQTGVVTGTGVTPAEAHTSTDVDLTTGEIYIGPYEPTGTTFQVYETDTNALTTLAPAPIPLHNHSTIVLVK